MIPNSFQPCGKIKLQLGLILLIGSSIACPLQVQASDLIQISEPITQTPNISSAPLQLNLQDVSASSSPINLFPLSQAVSEKREEPAELLETQLPPPRDSEAVSSEDVPTRIIVKKFKIEGQTVFEAEQLEKVATQFIKDEFKKELPTELTFAQLLQVRSAITQFYIKAGYITSGAFIPEQAFREEDGVVTLKIVEGLPLKEEDIKVDEDIKVAPDPEGKEQRNNPNFALKSKCLQTQLARQLAVPEPLNQNRILDSLRLLLQSDPRIASLDAELKPKPGSDLRTHQLTVRERMRRSNREALSLRGEFSLGTTVIPGDDLFFLFKNVDIFWVTRGQVQWVRRLAPETLLLIRGTVQLTTSSLPVFEQLGLGGQNTVRGYRNNFLLTDSGMLTSLELQLPVPGLESALKLAPFLDFGTGWNSSGSTSPAPSMLLSTGLGLQFQPSDRLTARVDWGIPLVSVDSTGDSLQEEGVYFSIRWTPF